MTLLTDSGKLFYPVGQRGVVRRMETPEIHVVSAATSQGKMVGLFVLYAAVEEVFRPLLK